MENQNQENLKRALDLARYAISLQPREDVDRACVAKWGKVTEYYRRAMAVESAQSLLPPRHFGGGFNGNSSLIKRAGEIAGWLESQIQKAPAPLIPATLTPDDKQRRKALMKAWVSKLELERVKPENQSIGTELDQALNAAQALVGA